MTDRIIACLISSDMVATAKFYRCFGFGIVSQDEQILHIARGPMELMFLRQAEPLPWDQDRVAVIKVDDVEAWRGYFANTRMAWKAMGRPGLTQIGDGAWGVPAFNVNDRDGNMIWVVQHACEPEQNV